MTAERRAVLLRGLAKRRRAARGHRQPRRPLDPRRVPRALGATTRCRERALRPGEGAPARAARRPAAHEAPLRPPHRPARRDPALRVFWGSSPERGGALFHARGRRLRGPARARPDGARRAARASAAARLHARQARPVLRAPGAAAVPLARGAGRRGLGVAVVPHRRRPVRRQRRLPAGGPLLRAGRAGRGVARARRVPRRSHRPRALPRAAPATRSPSRPPSGPCAKRAG